MSEVRGIRDGASPLRPRCARTAGARRSPWATFHRGRPSLPAEGVRCLRRGLVAIFLTSVTVVVLVRSGVRAPDRADNGIAPTAPDRADNAALDGSGSRPRLASQEERLGYPLARLVPSDALAFASAPSLARFLRNAGRTGIARMFEDPEIEPFLRRLTAEFAARNAGAVSVLQTLKVSLAGEGGGATGAHAGDGGAPAGEAALAVLGPERGTDRPHVLFLADVAGREGRARGLAGALETYALLCGRARRHAAGDATVTAVELPGSGVVGAWSVHRGLFVAGTSVPAVKEALARAEAEAGARAKLAPERGALEADETFATCVARAGLTGDAGAAHDYLAYMNVERASAELLGERAAGVLARAGLGEVRSVAIVGRIGVSRAGRADASVREGIYLHAPRRSRGAVAPGGSVRRGSLVRALEGPPVPLGATARLVPSRSLVALFGPVSAAVDGSISDIVPGLKALLDPVAESLKPLFGIHRRGKTNRRAARGGEACAWAFLWSVGRISWMPRLGAVAGPADQNEFAGAWAALARVLGGRLREHRTRGAPALDGADGVEPQRVLIRSIERMRFRSALVRSIAGCVRDSHLLAATDAAALRELLSAKRGGLGETEGMKWLLSILPKQKRFLLYMNVPRIVDRAFEPYAPAVVEALLPGSPDLLGKEAMPSGAALSRHLDPAALSVLSDAEGVRIDAVTPAGLLPILVAIYSAAVLVM